MLFIKDRVSMLNALWFRKPDGESLYKRYLAAAHQVSLELNISVDMQTIYSPVEVLIGSQLQRKSMPDAFFIVRYKNKREFDAFVTSDRYQAIRYLREEALEDSLLVQCRESSFT